MYHVRTDKGIVPFSTPDGFDLIHTLGSGSYGVVCSAKDIVNDREVAIKQITGYDRKRISRECRILKHFSGHDSMLQLLDVRVHDSCTYLFMELMYTNLSTAVQSFEARYGQLPLYLVRHIIQGILEGVGLMHDCKVVHCDLKSDNILVTQSWGIKISDFGFARPTGESVIGEVLIAEPYRPPEHIGGASHYQTSADVWCVGIILAILLAKQHGAPFVCHTREAHLKSIVHVQGWEAGTDVDWIENENMKDLLVQQPTYMGVGLGGLKHACGESYLNGCTLHSNAAAVELTHQMLTIVPNARPSIKQCLAHCFVQDRSYTHDWYDSDIEEALPRVPYSEEGFSPSEDGPEMNITDEQLSAD